MKKRKLDQRVYVEKKIQQITFRAIFIVNLYVVLL